MFKEIVREFLTKIDWLFWTNFYVTTINYRTGFHNPNYRFSSDQIAFIHIPKTGGTSLHTFLRTDSQKRFVNLNMHRPVSKLCDPSKYSYITVMRDPVERVWSYYQMVLQNPPNSPYKRFADKSLDCFLNRCWEVRNMACRYYSGEISKEPDEQTLRKALNNLSLFKFVILFDNFERGVKQLSDKYRIEPLSQPHMRQSRYTPLDQRNYAIIASYNQLDINLFKYWYSNF